MSDPQASAGKAVDKARPLSSIISKGFACFQGTCKWSLEAHEWNVDDAVAAYPPAIKAKDDAFDSVTNKRNDVCKPATTSLSVVDCKADGPQFSPDSEGTQSSRKHRHEVVKDAATSSLADKANDQEVDPVAKERKKVGKPATSSSSEAASRADRPQFSPDSESKQPFVFPPPHQSDVDGEAIEWSVDDVAANLLSDKANEQAVDSLAKERKEVCRPATTPSSDAGSNADGPQLSPVDSLAKERKEVCRPATTPSSDAGSNADGPQLSPDSEGIQSLIASPPDKRDKDSMQPLLQVIQWEIKLCLPNTYKKLSMAACTSYPVPIE